MTNEPFRNKAFDGLRHLYPPEGKVLDPTAPLVHSFKISNELAHPQLLAFPRFIKENLSFGQLPGISMGPMEAFASAGGHYVEFAAGPPRRSYEAHVRMYLERPIVVELRSSLGRDEAFDKQLENVLLMITQFYEEEVRKSTIYMTFLPGSPKTAEVGRQFSLLRTIFSGNLLNLFLLSILIGIFLFSIFGNIAPILMIVLMIALVLSAGRLSAWRSPWRITKTAREIVIVQQKVPEGELQNYSTTYRDMLKAAKHKAYETFSSCPDAVCADKMAGIFREAGLPAKDEDFIVRRIDVYGIVERVAAKFDLSVPAIVITSQPKPNAAATGFTRNLATMLITLGLLVQLDEEEIELVVGHELSHLRSGDPIVLFSLVAAEYLARVYVLWMYIGSFWLFYLLFVFWGIFFFGKFLESRADLEAALVLGKPKVMAESLKKIGFRRLVLEERFLEPEASRFGEWMRFDPHPPLYFRIQRLESLDLANPPRHPFLSSIRAVASGFVHSGRAR